MARHVSSKTARHKATELCTLQNDDDAGSSGSSSLNEPITDLRLVLLGGDCAYNNYVAEIILRTDKKKEMINPKKGTVREGSVDGRQLSVFVSPSYWMKHLDSFWFFSNGVESIRAELQNCTSMTFPGPHAFLLVMRAGQTPGKEHLLLKAITNVFGAEALDYTMVLFVYGHEWDNPKDALKNCCVKMCGTKYFILENNEENVEELFRRVEAMMERKQSQFFIQSSYENLMKVYFEPWEKAQAYKEMQLKRELDELKIEQHQREDELKTLRQTERNLREELEASRHQESVLREKLKTARCSQEPLRQEPVMIKGSEAGQWTPLRRSRSRRRRRRRRSKEGLNPNMTMDDL